MYIVYLMYLSYVYLLRWIQFFQVLLFNQYRNIYYEHIEYTFALFSYIYNKKYKFKNTHHSIILKSIDFSIPDWSDSAQDLKKGCIYWFIIHILWYSIYYLIRSLKYDDS